MSDLDFTRYWSADRTRKKQTALSKLSNGLRDQVILDNYTRNLFDQDEIEAIEKTISALSGVKSKFVHLKEKKKREEDRKAREVKNIESTSLRAAKKVQERLNSDSSIFTAKELCLWLMCIDDTRLRMAPEMWEIDIDDNLDNHYLPSDDALRARHVSTMRDKSLKAFQEYISHKVWNFSFETNSYVEKRSIVEVTKELFSLLDQEKFAFYSKKYSLYIAKLERYTRSVEAEKRRKNIKPV